MAKSRGASRLGVGSMNTKVHSFTKALALLGSCVVVATTCGVGGADEKPKAEARAPSAWVLMRRERRKTVCACGADSAALGGCSTSPLGVGFCGVQRT